MLRIATLLAAIIVLLAGNAPASASVACNILWSPDGALLLVEAADQTTFFTVGDDPVAHTFPGGFAFSERFDSTGTLALIGDQLIDMTTMTVAHTFPPESFARFDVTGDFIRTEQGIWEIATGAYLFEAEDLRLDYTVPIAWRDYPDTGRIDVYHLTARAQFTVETGITGQATLGPRFDPVTLRMAVYPFETAANVAYVYDLVTGERLATLETTLPELVSTSPDFLPGGRYWVGVSRTPSGTSIHEYRTDITVWDATGALVEEIPSARELHVIGTDTFAYIPLDGMRWAQDIVLWQDGEHVSLSALAGVELRRPQIWRLTDDRYMVMSWQSVYIWTRDGLMNREAPVQTFTVGMGTNGARINNDLTRLLTFDTVQVEITPTPPAIDAYLWNLETGAIILSLIADRPDDGSHPTREQIDRFQDLRGAVFDGDFLRYYARPVGWVLHSAESGVLLVEGATALRVNPAGDTAAIIDDGALVLLDATGATRTLVEGLACE